MFRRKWLIRAFVLSLMMGIAAPVCAENAGQEDLDKAIEIKVTAEKIEDLAQVVERLDDALEKGLDKENEEIAKQLLVGTLMQRGTMFAEAIFNVPQQEPQKGVRAMQLRSWALSDLQRALELDNSLVDAHLHIGKLQSLPLGDVGAARRAFSQVVKAEDATPEQKAEAYALRSALQTKDEQKVADFTKAVELAPTKPDYLRIRGQYYYSKEQFNEALADLDAALALDDKHAATHELRGMVLLGLEKYDEALASFDKASELEPEAALPYQHRAELYRQKGDLEKAVEQLTKALELAPDNVATLMIRSAVYFELKQNDKALADVDQAIQAAPRVVQPYLMRAEILAATDRLEEAITQLEELVKQVPGNPQLLNRLGSFYLMAGRPRKAIETFSQVIEAEPEDFSALRFRADAYLNIGQHAEAIADFDKALALKDDDESLLNNFAWVLATSPDDKLRNGKRAVELATKASELTGNQTPHVLSTLGASYAETGDFESAKKWSQQAVELAKKAVEAAKDDEERAKLQKDLEQLEKELASYEKGEPVRERQSGEEAPAKDEKKEGESDQEDRVAPSDAPESSDSTADFSNSPELDQ
jgi:tetratricopeptide (TPR) repeat protein